MSTADCDSFARALPLRLRGEVCAWSLVDLDDYDELSVYRWRLNTYGYAVRSVGERAVFLHRQLLGLERGDPRQGDHINRDPLDNRRANLRIVTPAEQAQNRRGQKGAKSKFRAVHWVRSKRPGHGYWSARPMLNGQRYELGRFESEIEAARVVEAWRAENMPFAMPDPALAEEAA